MELRQGASPGCGAASERVESTARTTASGDRLWRPQDHRILKRRVSQACGHSSAPGKKREKAAEEDEVASLAQVS